jgi:hypothetical protein
MIRSMCVNLSREDGRPDNTLVRVISVVAGQDFKIKSARLHECDSIGSVRMEVAYKGRTRDEPSALQSVMRLLGVSSLAEATAPAFV